MGPSTALYNEQIQYDSRKDILSQIGEVNYNMLVCINQF